MNTKQYKKFAELMELVPPPAKAKADMDVAGKNWALLHPILAKLESSNASLNVCRQYMYLELQREEGPRFHIMDRLYKRFSNLRREMETSAMMVLLPEEEMVAD